MPLYQVDVDGQTVEFDSPVDLTPEQLEAEVSGFRSQLAPPAAPEEAPGYLSQLGTSLYQGGRQALGGARTAFNALTGDTADMAAGLQQQAEAQRALQEAQTPEDVAFLEDLNKQAEELKQARGFLPTLSEAIDLPMAALRQPGAALKTAVQSLPNALISTPITLGAGVLGTAAGGLVGLPTTGPGAIATGIAGGIAAGTAANTALEAGSEIYQRFVERIGDPAGMTREQIAAALDQNPDIASEGLTTGLTRGAVIGTIETLGLKGAGALLAAPERAAIQATRQVLTRSGVDLADDAAVRAAMATPEMAKATKAAADAARAGFNVPARAVGAGAVEIGASGVGEALAQQAVGQETDYADVFLEMLGEGVAAAPSVLAARGVELAGTGIQAVRERVSEQVADNAKADARLDIDDLINNAGENAATQVNQAVDDAAKVVPAPVAPTPILVSEPTPITPIESLPAVEAEAPATVETQAQPEPRAPQDEIQAAETGGLPPVESQPVDQAPAVEAQAGTPLGGREGQEGQVTPEPVQPMGVAPAVSELPAPQAEVVSPEGVTDEQRFAAIRAMAPAARTAEDVAWANDYSRNLRRLEAERAAAEAAAKRAVVDEFLAPMTPMQRSKANAALEVNMERGNRVLPRRTIIEEAIQNGATVQRDAKGKRSLVSPSGAFVEESRLTKTAMDYAEFLLRRSQPLPPTGGVPTESLPAGQPTSGDVGAAGGSKYDRVANSDAPKNLEARREIVAIVRKKHKRTKDDEARLIEFGKSHPNYVRAVIDSERVSGLGDTDMMTGPSLDKGESSNDKKHSASDARVLRQIPRWNTQPTSGDVGTQSDPLIQDDEGFELLKGVAELRREQGRLDARLENRIAAVEAARRGEKVEPGKVFSRVVVGQPVITDAGLAQRPEAERPRLTEAERVAEIEGQGGVMASLRDTQRVEEVSFSDLPGPVPIQRDPNQVEQAKRRLAELAQKFNLGDIYDVANILERWVGSGIAERFGATPNEAQEARQLTDFLRNDVAYPPETDGYYYHVTTKRNAKAILKSGAIRPNQPRQFDTAATELNSRGRVFFSELSGVQFWRSRIQEQLDANESREKLTVLRIPKSFITNPQIDNALEQRNDSFFVKTEIPVNGGLRTSIRNTPPANVAPSVRPLQGDQQRNETSARRRRGKAQVPASLRDRDGPPLPNIKVNANDGARAREIEDKQVPGAKDTWIGTAAEYLAEFPDQTAVNDRRVEAFYDAATDRAVILIDRVVARDGDAIRAARNGTSAAVEAVRRLIRHESFVHRGWRALPQNLKTEFLAIAESLVPEEEIEAIVAKGYSRYAGWRTDPAVRALVVEEWLAQRLETLEKLPATDGGPLSRLIDWAKRVWQWLNGNDAVEPTRAELVDVMRQMIRALEIGEKESAARGAVMASLTDTDAAYMDAVARGDLETAQRLVDDAYRAYERANSKWFDVTDPTLGARYRGIEGYGAWMTRDGRLIPVENHTQTAKDFFQVKKSDYATQDAFQQGWLVLRAIKAGDYIWDVPTLAVEGGKNLSNTQRRNITDWAREHGYEINWDLRQERQLKAIPAIIYGKNKEIVPPSIRFPLPETSDIRFSLTDTDAAYMDAVYRKIMAKYDGWKSTDVLAPQPGQVNPRPYSPIVRDLLIRKDSGEDIPESVISRAIDEHFQSKKVDPNNLNLPSQEKVLETINSQQRAEHEKTIQMGTPEPGTPITARQDVPSHKKGVGVTTTQIFKNGKQAGTLYFPSVRYTDPVFSTTRGSEKIARGIAKQERDKTPAIKIDGKWSGDQSIPADLENWAQVGFNPDRHSYYYEKGTNKQVFSGDEAFQVGNTVFVKNPNFEPPAGFQPSEFRFSLTDPTASNIIQDANQTTNEQQPTRSRPLSPETAPGRATEVLPTGEEVVERTQIDKTSMPRLEALAIKFVDSLGPVDTWPNKILNTAWWRANGGNMRDDFGQMVMAEALYRTGIGALQGNPTLVEVNDLISREYQTGATEAAKALASRSYVTTSERYGPMFAVQGMVDQRRRQQETVIDANVDVAAGVDAVNNADAQAQSDASAELDEELRLKDAIYELGLAARTPEIQTRIRRINDNVFRLGVLAQIREQLLSRVQASFVGLSRAAVEQQYASLSVEQIDAEIARLEREVADDVAAVESERQRVRAAPKPKGAAADPITQARTIIARLEADPKTKKTPKANPVRDLYREHLKNPMAEDEFMTRMAGIGVPAAEAQKLYDLAAVKIAATEAVKAQREAAGEVKKLSDAERFAERVISDAAEQFADPALPIEENERKALPIRDLFNFHVQNGMTLEAFIPAAAQAGLDEATARRLHGAGLLVRDARQSIKAARTEARLDEVAANEAGRIIYETSKLHRQSGYINTASPAADTIRKAFTDQVKEPKPFEQFVERLKTLRVEEDLATRLFNVADREHTARKAMALERKRQRAAKEDSPAVAFAKRTIDDVASRLADPALPQEERQRKVLAIRELYNEHVRDGLPFDVFISRAEAAGVEGAMASTLHGVGMMEREARETTRGYNEAQAGQRFAEKTINDAATLYADPALPQPVRNKRRVAAQELYNKHVKKAMDQAEFLEAARKAGVNEATAMVLFNVGNMTREAREAQAYGRRLIERRERLLDAEGSALENLINKLRGKITGDLSWREMFDRPLETQRQWRRDLFAALRNDPALAGLTPQEIGDLVVEIDKVWEAKRKKNFEAQLKRMNLPGAKGNSKDKIAKSAPKLLRYINAGFFNDAAFRNAISEEFGIPALNEETVKQVVDLMQRAQADGITEVERKGLMLEAIRLMQRDLKAELGDILSNYWVTSVLSGFATQFDMAFSALNGMRVMAQSMADLAIRKREFKLAGRAGMAYLRALGNVILEAARYFYTGDPKLLDNYQYTLNTYLTEGSAAANPFDYFERIIKDPNRPSWKNIMPYFYAGMQRAMTAFDHINSTATTQGMLEMAMFYNRELYEGARMPSKEDVAAARAKAVEMAGGDKTWGQKREVSSYTRQILNELLNKKYPGLLDEARDIGKVVSYTNDPTGIGGIVYHTLLGVTNKYISEAGEYRDKVRAQQEAASRTKRFMANLNYLTAANARNMTGLRFVRFVGNRLNEILSFTPGLGLLRLQEKGMTPTMRAMIIQNQTLGLSLSVLAGVTILRALTDEEDDEKRGFRISGSWSSLPPDKKNQLRASGRSPYAIELWDGKKWISFNYNAWPVASIIATAGNLNDQRLFNPEKWEEKDLEDKLLSAAWAGAFSFKDLSALSGFMDMIGKSAYSTDPVEGATQWLAKFSTNYVGGFVPRMLKDIDLIMDPETRKARDFGAYFAKELPFFRRTEAAGEKLYNIFGEPVKLNRMPWRRAVTATREEPEYETLAELNRRGIFLGAANPSNRTVGSGATRRELTDAEAEKYMVETGKLYRDFIKQQGQSLLQLDRAQAEEVISKTTERLRAAALRMSIGATK